MGKMFILRERIQNVGDRTATRNDLAIIPVSELTEAAVILAKIEGEVKTDARLIDSCLGSDGGTCYQVQFTLQAVMDSKAWEEVTYDVATLTRTFLTKIDGTPIQISFRRSDGIAESEYFLVEKPALL
jgi:hypothetical protein